MSSLKAPLLTSTCIDSTKELLSLVESGQIGVEESPEGIDPGKLYRFLKLNFASLRTAMGDSELVNYSFEKCGMVFVNLEGANLQHSRVSKSSMIGSKARNTNLQDLEIFDSDARWCNWTSALLGRATIQSTLFSGSTLRGCDFTGCRLRGVSFRCADLEGALFDGAELPQCDFRGANLRNTSFRNAKLNATEFSFSDVEGWVCDGIDPSRGNFYKTTFESATTSRRRRRASAKEKDDSKVLLSQLFDYRRFVSSAVPTSITEVEQWPANPPNNEFALRRRFWFIRLCREWPVALRIGLQTGLIVVGRSCI